MGKKLTVYMIDVPAYGNYILKLPGVVFHESDGIGINLRDNKASQMGFCSYGIYCGPSALVLFNNFGSYYVSGAQY